MYNRHSQIIKSLLQVFIAEKLLHYGAPGVGKLDPAAVQQLNEYLEETLNYLGASGIHARQDAHSFLDYFKYVYSC